MQRSPQGSRLLAPQRAHRITDAHRSSTVSTLARHAVNGARPHRRPGDAGDAQWSLAFLVLVGLLFWVTWILAADPRDLPAAPAEAPGEVAR